MKKLFKVKSLAEMAKTKPTSPVDILCLGDDELYLPSEDMSCFSKVHSSYFYIVDDRGNTTREFPTTYKGYAKFLMKGDIENKNKDQQRLIHLWREKYTTINDKFMNPSKTKEKSLDIYYGGTFDPINFNHIEIVERIYDICKASYEDIKVYFLLDNDKIVDNYKTGRSSIARRSIMIQNAFIFGKEKELQYGKNVDIVVNDGMTIYEWRKQLKTENKVMMVFGNDCKESILAYKWTQGIDLLIDYKDELLFVSPEDTKGVSYTLHNDYVIEGEHTYTDTLILSNRKYNNISSTKVRKLIEIYHGLKEVHYLCVETHLVDKLLAIDSSFEKDDDLISIKNKILEMILEDTLEFTIEADLYMSRLVIENNSSADNYVRLVNVIEETKKSLLENEDIPEEDILMISTQLDTILSIVLPIIQIKYKCHDFEVVETKVNNSPYTYVKEQDMVVAIVHDVTNNNIYLTKQKRPYSDESIEPAGGKIDEGEMPITAAIRECEEELGIDLSEADSIMFLGKLNCAPGLFTSMTHMYWITISPEKGKDLKRSSRVQDMDEDVSLYRITTKEFKDHIVNKKFQDIRMYAFWANEFIRMIMRND